MRAGECCSKCCAAVVAATLRDADTPHERRLKELCVPPFVFLAVLAFLTSAAFLPFVSVVNVGVLMSFVCSLAVLAPAFLLRRLPLPLIEGVLLVLTLAMVLIDWAGAAQLGFRGWAVCVVIVDALLVTDGHDWVSLTVVAAVVAWLALERLEHGARFGLYEASWLDGRPPPPKVCDCAEPPCAKGMLAATAFAFSAAVFTLDFHFTRGFRDKVKEQSSLVAAAVEVSEVAAVHLSRYETDAAAEVVDGPAGARLPPALRAAYVALIANLRQYKPYLPQSVLTRGDGEHADPLIEACASTAPRSDAHERSLSVSTVTSSDSAPNQHRSRCPGPNWSPSRRLSVKRVPSIPSSSDDSGTSAAVPGASRGARPSASLAQRSLAAAAFARIVGFVQPSPEVAQGGSPKRLALAAGGARNVKGGSPKRLALADAGRGEGGAGNDSPRGAVLASFRGHPPGLLRIEPARKKVSLVACNHRGFLLALALEAAWPHHVSEWLTEEVTRCSEQVATQKGVVGLISADRVYASFGAVRVVGAHRQAAARAAAGVARRDGFPAGSAALASLPVSTAACSGPALCGDFGSAAQQQFMSLGGVSSLLLVLERLASRWAAAAVADAAVHAEAAAQWCCRLRGRAAYPKRGSVEPVRVWEVLIDEERGRGGCDLGTNQEWMYQLPADMPDRWEPYNRAMQLWIAGRAEDAWRAAGVVGAVEADVRGALRALQARIAASGGAMRTLLLGDIAVTEEAPSAQPSPVESPDGEAACRFGERSDTIVQEFLSSEQSLAKARDGERAQQLRQIDGKVREKKRIRKCVELIDTIDRRADTDFNLSATVDAWQSKDCKYI